MNVIKIPRNYKQYDILFFFNFIKTYTESKYIINKQQINNISKIDNYDNQQLILYVIYEILISDNLVAPVFPTPNNGMKLIINKDKESFHSGIYHAHLNDEYVLIWYITWDEYGVHLNLEYLKHPSDDYKSLIKRIYKVEYGYNENYYDYFINISKIIKENIITKFKRFLQI